MQLLYDGKRDAGEIIKAARAISANFPAYELADGAAICRGDNFHCMSRLLPHYAGCLDLVYIDPPFNTQNDFYYSPERAAYISAVGSSGIAYSDKMDMAAYLEFMRARLLLIHALTSARGTLYVHCDIKAGHYLKVILDEIYGQENFINEITRVKSNPKNFARRAFGNEKDVILVYAKKAGENIFNDIREHVDAANLKKRFPKIDAFGRMYTTVPCHAPGETRNGPTGGKWREMLPPPGRHWRCAPAKLDELDSAGLIEWSRNGVPRIKKFAAEHRGDKIQDVWPNFKDPPYPLYPTEKNMAMLELIVRQSSSPGSLLMDCFCGSGAFLAAASRHGRRVIGIDRSDVAIGVARERAELKNMRIFLD